MNSSKIKGHILHSKGEQWEVTVLNGHQWLPIIVPNRYYWFAMARGSKSVSEVASGFPSRRPGLVSPSGRFAAVPSVSR